MIAAISLLNLATAPVWAQENTGEVESFNRRLGLEGMGTDFASVERELEPATQLTPPKPQRPRTQRRRRPKSNLRFSGQHRLATLLFITIRRLPAMYEHIMSHTLMRRRSQQCLPTTP